MPFDTKQYLDTDLPAAVARNAEEARRIGNLYQLKVTGLGNWVFDFKADPPTVRPGTSQGCACTIEVGSADVELLLNHPLVGVKLFLVGRIKVTGNPMLAENFRRFLEKVGPRSNG
jgi:hypothetical protein